MGMLVENDCCRVQHENVLDKGTVKQHEERHILQVAIKLGGMEASLRTRMEELEGRMSS